MKLHVRSFSVVGLIVARERLIQRGIDGREARFLADEAKVEQRSQHVGGEASLGVFHRSAATLERLSVYDCADGN